MNNPFLTAALEYVEKGWRVFPLVEKSKVPNRDSAGLHDATTDPAQIVEWWTKTPKANIGLRGGGGLCIVDADVKNGKDGLRALEAMDVNLDTLSVCTPSGGRHFYYRTGENFVNSQNAITGVDVRSEGAYVLAPPSVIDNREYEWLDEGMAEIEPLPKELAEHFKTFDCQQEEAGEFVMDIDPPNAEEAARLTEMYVKYLSKNANPAIEGEAGHSALLFVAIRGVHGFRLPKDVVLSCLWDHYNPRCQPPWEYENPRERYEFERKVTEAMKLKPKRIVCELTRIRKSSKVESIKDRINYFVSSKGQGTYYFRRDDGNYQPMNESTLRRHLKRMGMSDAKPEGDTESEIGHLLLDCQMDKMLRFAGNIAGYDSGLHQTKRGDMFLSLQSPITPDAEPGEWDTLRQVLVGLFVDGENLNRFMAWFYWCWLYLHEREWAPMPVVALAGPKNCGKSLLVDLVSRVLGDTEKGQALSYVTGDTKFNADLAGSHLLVVDDEISSMDMRSRRHTGQRIKALAVLNDHRIEAKGFDAMTLSPHWRCMFATNDEPESLQVLPIIDDGLADKILLLRCKKVEMPMKARTPRQRREFMDTLLSEVPAMLHFLQESDIVDRYGSSNRMSVEGWQDEILLESLRSFDAHRQLLDLIDILKPWDIVEGKWEGTAAELEGMLKSDQATARAAEKTLSWTNACGTYLGRLAKEPNSRVEHALPIRDRKWIIYQHDRG